ncbi:DeoR/GlpR transcriptional regulator [Alicyclobacillus curvatus]|jgi:DeoR/GlpR family transcriptional regulator of sugar metabolism|nr:DeoR/GlpR transcriptional regulator [Alicyclobacillus curvatus]
MLSVERQTIITDMIAKERLVKVTDLTQLFSVSEMTIRRDLDALEKKGVLRKVYGGAVAETLPGLEDVQDVPLDVRSSKRSAEKQAIARRAVDFIEANDVIFLDAGTTTVEIARLIRHRADVVVITNSLLAAYELTSSAVTLILIGGQVRSTTQSVVGVKATQFISDFVVSTCFIGASGLSVENGLMNTNLDESELKRRMIRQSDRSILVADTSKFYSPQSYHKFAEWSDVDIFVTDDGLPPEDEQKLRQFGPNVIVVPGKEGHSE